MWGLSKGTLRYAVWRAHIDIALAAVTVACLLLLAAGLTGLRTNTQEKLQLMTRSLIYNVEAALVFGDSAEAVQALERLVHGEDVAQATVWNAQGQVFASWQEPAQTRSKFGRWLADALGVEMAVQDVTVDGLHIGKVGITSNGRSMLDFVLWGLLVLTVCMVASMAIGQALAKRMVKGIVQPLQELGEVARAVHRDRAMGKRVSPADLAELRELGEHINALLDELEARQLHLQQENIALEHKAYHDGLTGLYNRVYFELRLMTAIRQSVNVDGHLALLFMDCDRFKEVNDTYGHAVGDQLLQAVATRIASHVRGADVVARLGGDEFVVLLVEPGSLANVDHLAQKIHEAVTQPLDCGNGLVLNPLISIGIALYPQDGSDMDSLMTAADEAMYRTKRKKVQLLDN